MTILQKYLRGRAKCASESSEYIYILRLTSFIHWQNRVEIICVQLPFVHNSPNRIRRVKKIQNSKMAIIHQVQFE